MTTHFPPPPHSHLHLLEQTQIQQIQTPAQQSLLFQLDPINMKYNDYGNIKIDSNFACKNNQTDIPVSVSVIANKKNSKQFGDYIIGKTLGEGTFGKVKLAIHKPTQEKVAIKILQKKKISQVADAQRVKREIHILKLIHHPNLVQLYQIIQTPKQLLLIMQFMENGELFQYIVKNKRIKQNEACRIFHQIIDGIQYMHKIGIVHRDLKPQNIIFDYRHSTKIVDFGLGNIYKKGQNLKTPCGSPCYAAPQMIQGEKYDGLKVDIWSSGVILFAMICGYLPFQDEDVPTLYKKILACEYQCHKSISPSGKDLIQKILKVNKNQRFTIEQIRNHEWMKQTDNNNNNRDSKQKSELLKKAKDAKKGIIVGYADIPVNAQVLKQMKKNQPTIDIQAVSKSLQANRHNNLTTTYYLFQKKMQRENNQVKLNNQINQIQLQLQGQGQNEKESGILQFQKGNNQKIYHVSNRNDRYGGDFCVQNDQNDSLQSNLPLQQIVLNNSEKFKAKEGNKDRKNISNDNNNANNVNNVNNKNNVNNAYNFILIDNYFTKTSYNHTENDLKVLDKNNKPNNGQKKHNKKYNQKCQRISIMDKSLKNQKQNILKFNSHESSKPKQKRVFNIQQKQKSTLLQNSKTRQKFKGKSKEKSVKKHQSKQKNRKNAQISYSLDKQALDTSNLQLNFKQQNRKNFTNFTNLNEKRQNKQSINQNNENFSNGNNHQNNIPISMERKVKTRSVSNPKPRKTERRQIKQIEKQKQNLATSINYDRIPIPMSTKSIQKSYKNKYDYDLSIRDHLLENQHKNNQKTKKLANKQKTNQQQKHFLGAEKRRNLIEVSQKQRKSIESKNNGSRKNKGFESKSKQNIKSNNKRIQSTLDNRNRLSNNSRYSQSQRSRMNSSVNQVIVAYQNTSINNHNLTMAMGSGSELPTKKNGKSNNLCDVSSQFIEQYLTRNTKSKKCAKVSQNTNNSGTIPHQRQKVIKSRKL